MNLKPDLEFIESLKKTGGETVKKCYQCASCSVACPLSSDQKPFPRKEMIWAQWGQKDILFADPDVLLLDEPAGAHVAYVKSVDLLAGDLGIPNGHHTGLSDHVAQRDIPSLSELGAAYTNYGYGSHILSLPLCLAYMA